MFGGFLAWIPCLFEPFADYGIPPIQPQERLQQGWQDIITGVYGHPPLLKIHDRDGTVNWSFHRDDVTQSLPDDVHNCLYADANDATEIKYMNNGTSVGAVRNDALWNAHTLEPLPGNLIAVGTTGQSAWDGILVYNASTANELVANPPILQNITGLRAIHALVWDEQGQMLWAVGTDVAADGSDPDPAYGTIVGYPWDSSTGLLSKDDHHIYKLPEAYRLETEWGKGYTWWAGLHDLVPIPGQRKFLVSEDRGLHAFDIESGQFTEHYENVTNKYLPGFEVTTNDRHGYNGDGEWEELPQSDLKSFNIAPDGSFIYVQSLWTKLRAFHTSLVVHGKRRKINIGDEIYRSRWFGYLNGWPKP